MLTAEQRADKAGWIHDHYVTAFDSQNIGLGERITQKQHDFLKKKFKEIDREADKIFGK